MTTATNPSDKKLSEIRNILRDIEITDIVQKTLDQLVRDTLQSNIRNAMKEAFQSNDFGAVLAKLQEEDIVVTLEMINDHDLMRDVQITHDMSKTLVDMISDQFIGDELPVARPRPRPHQYFMPDRIKEAFESNFLGVVFLALQHEEQTIFDLAWINKSNLLAGVAITSHAEKTILDLIHADKEEDASMINESGPEAQVDSLVHGLGVSGEDIRNALMACEHVQEPDM